MQLVGGKLHAFSVEVEGGHLEGSFFQPTVEYGKAALLIDQHLQVGPGLVDEDKGVALRYLPSQLIEDNATQQVKALAHVRLLAV